MRKSLIITALLCLVCVLAKAQYGSLIINNNTSCDAYVQISGTASTICLDDYITDAFIMIPAHTSANYTDPSMVTPQLLNNSSTALGSTGSFTLVKLASGNPLGGCSLSQTALLSDCIAGATTNVPNFQFDNSSCTTCSTPKDVTFTGMGNTAVIDIN